MADSPSLTPLLAMIAVVIIVAGAGAAFLYYHDRPTSAPSTRVVQVGDNVTVNYIGIFGSGPESGKVFDTSIYSVANDNIAFPKSLEYHARGSVKNYSTLAVHVGGNTPQAGYSLGGLTFIQVVTGFWQGVVGIPTNQTHTIIVPPLLGYGPTNPACVAKLPLTFTVPVVVTMAGAQFQKTYPGALAATGAVFSDPHYGWTVTVLSANSSYVTIENLPTVGQSASPAGWPIVVTAINPTANGSGAITLVNQLNPNQAGQLLGKDFLGTGPCTSTARGQFIVTNVDLVHGTYTENYNPEVQGQTLIFVVTPVNLYPPLPPAV